MYFILVITCPTFCITVMSVSKVFDHFPLTSFVGKDNGGVTVFLRGLCWALQLINSIIE